MIYIIQRMYKLYGINQFSSDINIPDKIPASNDIIKSLELGAAIHKNVRKSIQPMLKPGLKLLDLVESIEKKTEELSQPFRNNTINKGIGFPCGLSLNNCAAHWAPYPNDNTILTENDVLKIDFGTEINEWIIDSAFTISFNEKYNNLLLAVQDATNTGIKNAGIDVVISDWGNSIKEVMESYEIESGNKIVPIKNLGGHNILKGIIHGGTFLPSFNNGMPGRFKTGVYAIETFGTTGSIDNVSELNENNLYRINPYTINNISNLKLENSRKFFKTIYNRFKTLPFTDRYVYDINNYKTQLNILAANNFIHKYPPLVIKSNDDKTAQYEHTIYISENKKIILSNSDDY